MKIRSILICLLYLAVILVTAPYSKAVSDHDGTIGSGMIQGSGSENHALPSDDQEPGVYIIRLADPPLAMYEGDIPGLSATRAPSIGEKRLNVRSPASRAYRKHLSDKQDQVTASLRQRIDPLLIPIYRYETAFNGMALWLTPAQAAEVADIPEVVSVQRDKLRQLTTDTTPALVNAETVWDGTGTGGLPGTQGEGVIVGIIDSGVWPEHPSFADDGTYPRPPMKWGGKCTPPADGTKGYTCSNKLIGIQFFLDAYIAYAKTYNGLFRSGRDDNGHGTYTASIAAGNKDVPVRIYGIDRGTVSGMAPRAHIAVYKAVGPGGATQGDLLAAIDKAVADGVDIINYSIGSSFDSTPWNDPDALAFLAAREAGIFVTVSAGNNGPDSQTIGSPGNAPWLVTVGASYPDRLFLSDIEIRPSEPDSGPGSDPAAEIQNFFGASPTRGISNFNLIDAEGIPDIEEDASGNCLNPFPTGTFRSTDTVLCKRGEAPGPVKANFVQDGGAGAILFYNNEKSNDFNSYAYSIPAVFVSYEVGLEIKERIETSESPLLISFTQGEPVHAPDPRIAPDTVAAFSSRGPSVFSWIDFAVLQVVTERINIIKPDVTAPGIHILAGASPEYMINANGNTGRFGHQGEFFQISQGTSMSSPCMAGLGALLLTLHPDWTPTQIQSALMLTAVSENQTAKGAEGNIPATPFDAGSGRVDVSRAARAGFTLDETGENFRAANPATDGEASALNLPGLTNAECLGKCSWKRTLQSAADVPINWTVGGSGIMGQGSERASPIIADPLNFILEPGETQEMTFTADVRTFPAGQWIFSDIHFTPEPVDTGRARDEASQFSVPVAHFPVAIQPIAGTSPVRFLEIETRRDQGTYTLKGLTSIETDSLTVTALVGEPESFEGTPLAQDSENDEVYDDPDDGIFIQLVSISEDVRRFIIEITDTSADDLDLYIGRDDNNDGKPDPGEELCKRSRSMWNESCSLPDIGERLEPGNYWIMIQNYEASDEESDEFTFSITLIDEESKIDPSGTALIRASGPSEVALNEPFDIKIAWDNIPGFKINDIKEGWLEIGTDASHADNIAAMPLTLSRIEDDVTISTDGGESVYPRDTLTYNIRIVSDNVHSGNLTYTLVSTIPEGMTYIPGSATVEPSEIRGNQLIWIVEAGMVNISYEVTIDKNIIPPGAGFSLPRQLITRLEHSVAGGRPAIAETAVTVIENPMISISSGEITLAIPDKEEVTSSLDVPRKVALTDLNVFLNIRHQHPSDLSAWLISPSGVEVTLFNHLTATRENFTGTLLDDDAETSITSADAPFTGSFRPAEPLSTLSGEVTEGEWTLKIYDDQLWDEGILLSWGLDIKFASAGPVANDDIAVTGENESVSIDVLANDTDGDGDPLTIMSVSVPSHGTATHDGAAVIYTPEPGFIGTDTFTYTITDNNEEMARGDVLITVKRAGVTIIVTTLNDSIKDNERISFREALLAAETDQSIDGSPKGGFRDTIILPPGTIQLDSEVPLTITRALRIVGSAEGTIIKGKGAARVIHVHEDADVEIRNLTIQGRNPASTIQHPTSNIKHPTSLWMAFLIAKESAPDSGRFCNGTLIHPEWVLTSGQCAAYGMENSFDVMVGHLDAGERIQPDMTLIHPDFDPVTLDSDIALIHLSVPSAQPPIDLIPPGDPVEMAKPGTSATVIGWDVTEPEPETCPESLSEISVLIVENEKANQLYVERLGIAGAITGNMLVAAADAEGKNSCTGNSGGPLMVEIPNPKSQIPSIWVQAGIASWGEGYDLPGYYSIYTRISRFTSWVYEQIGGLPPFDADISGGVLNQGTLLISGSTLTGNSGMRGGAIHNLGKLTLLNSTVSGNSATLGGGIFNEGNIRIVFSTIAKNEARYGGGIFNGVTGTTEIRNTLIAGNSLAVAGSDLLGSIMTRGNNLISESAGGSGYHSHDLLDMPPLMIPVLMSNGGPTLTHAIQVNGPAADAADCTDMEGNKVETDQRGAERQELCDIGAFEYDNRDYPPVASDDVMFTVEKPVSFDVLQNDRDANGDDLLIIEFSEPENGVITISPSSLITHPSLLYTPYEGFLGTDTFTYMISDGTQISQALVTVTTLPDNPLMVQDDEALTQANTPVVIKVLANDSDPEGNPLEVIEAAQPANGSAVTNGTVVSYSPVKDFTGTDRFMYSVTDGVKTGKAFVIVTVGDPDKCHSADYSSRDYEINLSELLRVIQIYTNGAYTCGDPSVEDGYGLDTGYWKLETGELETGNANWKRKLETETGESGTGNSEGCMPHHSDYNPQDWRISLSELLRLVQLYNSSGYHPDPEQEDGFGLGK